MNREKFITAFKISIITFLILAISMLAVMRWKSDMIMDKVLASVQDQLTDSLRYSEAGIDWFSHFPSTAIQINNLFLGSGKSPLIAGGDVAIVIRLIPLLKGNIVISQLHLVNSTIHIHQHDGKWSYEIIKKSEASSDESFNTRINELVIENTTLKYNDGKGTKFDLRIKDGKFKGDMEKNILDLDIDINSSLTELVMDGYRQVEPFPSRFTGQYVFDMNSGRQSFTNLNIENEAIQLSANGTVIREPDHEMVDMDIQWKKANPEMLKKWLPEKIMADWKNYTLYGESDGEAKIQGKSSTKDTPHISSTATLRNGGIDFMAEKEEIKGLNLEVIYDSGGRKSGRKSNAEIIFKKSSMLGGALEGNIKIENLDKPTFDINLTGSLPAGLLNLIGIPGMHFEKGSFDIDHFELNRFQTETSSFSTFLQRGKTSVTVKNISLTYLNNAIAMPRGDLHLEGSKLNLSLDAFNWNKASVTDLKGWVSSKENELQFNLDGILCEGKIETKGTVTSMNQRPVSNATWKVKGIEIKQLLESFSNFDQTFITAENLKGKTNIWAESTIPFDEKWNIITNKVMMKSAIDITDGQLKGLKTLEDFGTYVHLNDLRDIRFNQLRNYMKIENGTVYLPVMFIQSSALNLSISGEHRFNQEILYYLKLNAGQVVSTKLKKNDVRKDFKQARKSGWINMYYVLEGTTANVKYQQYRNAVIAGFEQSSALKENLRKDLVTKFGYDEVYWIEPNEWEDIPEYE